MKEVVLLSVNKQMYEKVWSISTSKLASSSLLHRAGWIRIETLSHGMEKKELAVSISYLTKSIPLQ